MEQDIYSKVEAHVSGLFAAADTSKLTFHNAAHTLHVVEHAKEISDYYNLIDNDKLIVFIAAWFHDTGYLFAPKAVHEEKSIELMKEFMKHETQYEELVGSIEDCIMATRLPSAPKNLLEQIVADADTYHAGGKDFFEQNVLIYQETIHQQGYLSKQDWDKKAINFLEQHQFFTNYTREKLAERKKKNLQLLKKELKVLTQIMPEKTAQKTNKKDKKIKGINSLMRLTIEHQSQLIALADGKANVLIAVNFIAISILLSALLIAKGYGLLLFTIPFFILLFFSLLTLLLAIVATRSKAPKLSPGDPRNISLFNTAYDKMPFENYEKQVNEMMSNADGLNSYYTRYMYDRGLMITRKNKLIRWSLIVFMFGAIASVSAFVVVLFF